MSLRSPDVNVCWAAGGARLYTVCGVTRTDCEGGFSWSVAAFSLPMIKKTVVVAAPFATVEVGFARRVI